MIDNGLLVQMILGALLGLSVYLPMAAGQLSLATPAFYAVGGTLAALLSTQGDTRSAISIAAVLGEMLLAAGLTAGLALLVGLPVLRLRGIYLAIATIALVEIVRVAILNLPFTGGATGIFGIPQPFQQPFGYVLFSGGFLALCGWLCQRLEASRLGRSMAAIRDDELASRCMGINTTRVKLSAFVASASLLQARLGGVLLTGQLRPAARQAVVDAFQAGRESLLISTYGTGGLGFNLQRARHVVLLERPWTPGDAEQAEDRCHRIGQRHGLICHWLQLGVADQLVDDLIASKAERIALLLPQLVRRLLADW